MSQEDSIQKMRLDRWLWVARLFKSRSMATEACKKCWVKINEISMKPSREVQIGEVITIKFGPLEKKVRIEGLCDRRVSAVLAKKLLTDLTTPEELERATVARRHIKLRPASIKGVGRPTKKQRRDLEDFLYSDNY